MQISDVAVCHEELLALEEQLGSELRELEQLTVGAARAEALGRAQDTSRRLARAQQQYRVELRLADDTERAAYATQTAAHNRVGAQLARQLQTQQVAAPAPQAGTTAKTTTTTAKPSGTAVHVDANSQMMAARAVATTTMLSTSSSAAYSAPVVTAPGANTVAAPMTGTSDTPASTAARDARSVWSPRDETAPDDGRGELRHAALRIQDVQQSALQSLATTERLLGQTEQVGNDAARTLLAQTRQIEQTNEQLHEMHSDLQRARSELRQFMRRMARDRLIIALAIANVVCVIIIVVLSVVKHYLR